MANSNYIPGDTIVALATPQGVGAIGVIRLSGPKAIAICDSVFYGKQLSEQASHTIHFGTIRSDEGNVIDEVLVSLFIAPKSYTKENVVEISGHGSPYILQQIIQILIKKGARMAQPGEFTLRAFLNGQMDLSQAEAVADLIAANSQASHQIAMQQMRGGISTEIQKLRRELIDFAALIELELDFGEEDVEFADRKKLENLIIKIKNLLQTLMDSFRLGNALKEGINTVIAGRPNAGKSTLLNALLQEDRAIVSDIAGTTRDLIEEILNIDGITFRLIDTAGLREATDTIEAIGIKKTLEKVNQSSILVYVYDSFDLEPPQVKEDIAKLYKEGMKVLIIGNKSDMIENMYNQQALQYDKYYKEKYQKENWGGIHKEFEERGFLHIKEVSAKTNRNIILIKRYLINLAIGDGLTANQTIVANSRHYEALSGAHQSLDQALTNLQSGITGDFVAMDIRHALNYLGEITGEISTDDLLDSIFTRFCIGK